jgi:multidrug efflux pump subunit AcrB
MISDTRFQTFEDIGKTILKSGPDGTGEFFKALSLTMAASLVISFLIAWIALPVISTRLLSTKDAQIDDVASWPGQFIPCTGDS